MFVDENQPQSLTQPNANSFKAGSFKNDLETPLKPSLSHKSSNGTNTVTKGLTARKALGEISINKLNARINVNNNNGGIIPAAKGKVTIGIFSDDSENITVAPKEKQPTVQKSVKKVNRTSESVAETTAPISTLKVAPAKRKILGKDDFRDSDMLCSRRDPMMNLTPLDYVKRNAEILVKTGQHLLPLEHTEPPKDVFDDFSSTMNGIDLEFQLDAFQLPQETEIEPNLEDYLNEFLLQTQPPPTEEISEHEL